MKLHYKQQRETVLITLYIVAYPERPKPDRYTIFGNSKDPKKGTPLYVLAERDSGGFKRAVYYMSKRISEIYKFQLDEIKKSEKY